MFFGNNEERKNFFPTLFLQVVKNYKAVHGISFNLHKLTENADLAYNNCRNSEKERITPWLLVTSFRHFPLTVSAIHPDSVHYTGRNYSFLRVNFPLLLPHRNRKA